MATTTESRVDDLDDLQALAQRLNRPASSLGAYVTLDRDEHAVLRARLDTALADRRTGLDQALARLIPWPIRAVVLRWLRR